LTVCQLLSGLRKYEIRVGISLEIKIDDQRRLRTTLVVFTEYMYSMLSTPVTCCSIGVATDCSRVFASATGVVSLQPDSGGGNVRKLCDWQKRNRDRANDDGKDRDHNLATMGRRIEKTRPWLSAPRFFVRRWVHQFAISCFLCAGGNDSFSRLRPDVINPKLANLGPTSTVRSCARLSAPTTVT